MSYVLKTLNTGARFLRFSFWDVAQVDMLFFYSLFFKR
jgi:hypothetical protein